MLPARAGSRRKAKAAASVKVTTSAKTYSMTVAGLKRSYEVIAPVKAPPKSAPVIVVLSGIYSTVPGEISRDDLLAYATANEAELVYPVAFDESWNAITCCGEAATKNVNDLAFLKALVAKVDPGHARSVYVVGYSNGARMAYRVACDDPALFDGYAMVKGGPTPGCNMRKPVTILQLASMNDPEIPYKPGDKGIEPLAMTTLVADLRTAAKCPAKSAVTHSGSMTLTTWSGVRGRHPPRVRGVEGRRALLPPAARQRPGGLPGHLVLLHEDPDSPAAVVPGDDHSAALSRQALHGQGQPHDGAAARGRLGGDRAAVADDDLADDGEAEAGAGSRAG